MSLMSFARDTLGWSNVDKDRVELEIEGIVYSGWTDIVVRCGVDIMPWSANLTMSARDPETETYPFIDPGHACRIRIGGRLMLSGYVVTVDEHLQFETHVLSVSVASKSIDLIECSALLTSYQINDTNALHIAEQVCTPFGLTLTSINGAGNADISSFSVVLTETGYQVIERLARLAGVLFYDTPDGNIVFSGVSSAHAGSHLAVGQNVEASRFHRSQEGCYSEITAVLQNNVMLFEPPAEDKLVQQMSALTTGIVAKDPTITRRRPLLVPVEVGDANLVVTKQRVMWEMARRQGRGLSLVVTTDSWQDADGEPWTPNTRVTYTDMRNISSEWVIAEVTFSGNINGFHSELVLVMPSALTPQPILNPLAKSEVTVAIHE